MSRLFLWLVLPTWSAVLWAQPLTIDPYYQDHSRGWFWYESKPEEMPEPVVIPESPPPQPPASVPIEEQPMSHAWYRKYFQQYKDAAMDNPDDQEAMATYLYLEKAMRDKATKFAYSRQDAVFADPYLDETVRRSTANFGMKAMNRQASHNQAQLLRDLGQRSGLFFFYRSDCPYCKQQAPVLDAFAAQYHFTVKPVSMDGKPLPGYQGDYLVNQGQAEMAGIAVVPAMVLFDGKTKKMTVVAQGLQSLPEFSKRLLAAAERLQMIQPNQRQQTRPSGLYQTPTGDQYQQDIPSSAPDSYQKLLQHTALSHH